MFSFLEFFLRKHTFYLFLTLIITNFFSSVSFSQNMKNDELDSKLVEFSRNFDEYKIKMLSESDGQNIVLLKKQMDQSVDEISHLIDTAPPLKESYKDYIQAYYDICSKIPPELREKNGILLNDFSVIENLLKEQAQSIYPDVEVIKDIWQVGNRSFYASSQSDVDFLNSSFLSAHATVCAILDMSKEIMDIKNRTYSAKSHYIRFDENTDEYYRMRSIQLRESLAEEFDLEQVINEAQELISYYEKYEQFFCERADIWKCMLALAYLKKGEIREGGKIIMKIRQFYYDDFNPQAPDNTHERIYVCFLICKFYAEAGLQLKEYPLALEWLEDTQQLLPHTQMPQAVGYEYYYRTKAEILKNLGREEEAKASQAEAEKIAANLEKCRNAIREAIQKNEEAK